MTPRDLPTVIARMLEVIPENEADLRLDLKSIASSAVYSAPEMAGFWWEGAAVVLSEQTPRPLPEWAAECASIFAGRL